MGAASSDTLGFGRLVPGPGWVVLDAAREQQFTGELVLIGDVAVRVYLERGRIYLAERATDPTLADRLVQCGALTQEQLDYGRLDIAGVDHLGRLFDRVPTASRDAVMVATEMMNDQVVSWLAGQQVQSVGATPYRHHGSGIHRWNDPSTARPSSPWTAPTVTLPDLHPTHPIDAGAVVPPATSPTPPPSEEPVASAASTPAPAPAPANDRPSGPQSASASPAEPAASPEQPAPADAAPDHTDDTTDTDTPTAPDHSAEQPAPADAAPDHTDDTTDTDTPTAPDHADDTPHTDTPAEDSTTPAEPPVDDADLPPLPIRQTRKRPDSSADASAATPAGPTPEEAPADELVVTWGSPGPKGLSAAVGAGRRKPLIPTAFGTSAATTPSSDDSFGVIWPTGEVDPLADYTAGAPDTADPDTADPDDGEQNTDYSDPDTPEADPEADPGDVAATDPGPSDEALAVRRAVATIDTGSLAARRRLVESTQAPAAEPPPAAKPMSTALPVRATMATFESGDEGEEDAADEGGGQEMATDRSGRPTKLRRVLGNLRRD